MQDHMAFLQYFKWTWNYAQLFLSNKPGLATGNLIKLLGVGADQSTNLISTLACNTSSSCHASVSKIGTHVRCFKTIAQVLNKYEETKKKHKKAAPYASSSFYVAMTPLTMTMNC